MKVPASASSITWSARVMRPAETGDQAGHRASRVDFPAPFGPEHAEDLAGCGGEGDREGETAAPDLGIDDEAAADPGPHWTEPPRSQRSRRETSTTTETRSSTRLRAIAALGSVSSA